MVPRPSAIGLWICEQVIVDAQTNNPSLISIDTGRRYPGFPTEAIPFSVFCSLTDTAGSGRMRLDVEQLATGRAIYSRSAPIEFPQRFAVVNVSHRIQDLRFPEPGTYMFELFVDDESVARRRLRVY
ncbi:MAG TPA: hypothetical protein VML55_17095 [Planctomycetaceae bacterium]|nr:hypothetical protein [Planctomycetaceae bacterium]